MVPFSIYEITKNTPNFIRMEIVDYEKESIIILF